LRIPTLLLVLLMAQVGWKSDQKLPRPPDVSEAMVDSMAGAYYEAKLRCYPALATRKGVPGYDGRLSTYSQRSTFGLLARVRNAGNRLVTLDEDSLSMGKWVEYKALLADMASQRFLLEDLEVWRSRPTIYVDACVDGIALLCLAQIGRGQSIDPSPRLAAVPTVIKHARRNLTDPSEFHCRVAADRLGDLIRMLENLRTRVSSAAIDSALIDQTVVSLRSFGDFIDSLALSASTRFTLGYDEFLLLMDTRNMISDLPEDIRAYAKGVLDRTNEELAGYESGDLVAGGHLGIEDIEDWAARARDFIEMKDLVSLPGKEVGSADELGFSELPDFAAGVYKHVLYIPPAPDAPEAGRAIIYVPPEVREPGATAGGIITSEAFPGRHLQAYYSAVSPSPVRRMNTDIFAANGWALYSQELMAREGFGGEEAIRDALLRKRFYAAGTIAAMNILLGEFTVQAAADFMVNETGVSEAYARELAVQYALEPELPMSYIIGERQINRIRDEIESIQGEEFDLKGFHDSLLTSGRLPLYLLRNNLVSGSVGRR